MLKTSRILKGYTALFQAAALVDNRMKLYHFMSEEGVKKLIQMACQKTGVPESDTSAVSQILSGFKSRNCYKKLYIYTDPNKKEPFYEFVADEPDAHLYDKDIPTGIDDDLSDVE